MKSSLSRREFLKVGALTAGAAAYKPDAFRVTPPFNDQSYPLAIGRVTTPAIYIYKEPSSQSERIGKCTRDQLVSLLEEIESPSGPPHNPLWYRLLDGYAHSGRIQRIEPLPSLPPLTSVPQSGLLGEIIVPFTRSYRYFRTAGWQSLYRLYYQSAHWIVGIDEGPDGLPWYRLRDTLLNVFYNVPASTMRPIAFSEFTSIDQEIPPEEKRIVISIEEQSLSAYAGDQEVMRTPVSTGIHSEIVEEGELPTDTPTGNFHIQLKMPTRHMGDGKLTSDVNAYELPGVPWTMVFHETGVALHGTYWHDNFGARMSHGCVNLRSVDAKWLFRWTDPVYDPSDWYQTGYGTLVQII